LERHKGLFDCAKEEGLICFSSPFDKTALDLLEDLDVPAYKIASSEIKDIPLIEYAVSQGKPIILSTGIAGLEDIVLNLDACRRMGNNQIGLLICDSSYPAPIEEANMGMIAKLKECFGISPSLSDHTLGSTVPIVATTLGAKIIEKHIILDRSIVGPDAAFSMNEEELTAMVEGVREAEKAVGKVSHELTEKQIKGSAFTRSLYVVKDIKNGEVIIEENVRSIRPGFGMHPRFLNDILGKASLQDPKKGERVTLGIVEY
jgi:pseudaminic acid synthase